MSPNFCRLTRIRRLLGFDMLEHRCMLSAGNLDPSFGLGGLVTTDLFGGSDEQITDIAIQADGKIVASGSPIGTGTVGQDFALARYNADGTLDASFGPGGTGIVNTNIDGHDYLNRIAIDGDGKIVAVGAAAGDGYFAVARYSADGILDTTFGDNGTKKIDVVAGAGASMEGGFGFAFQSDGKIVWVGSIWDNTFSNRDIALLRLNTNGSLDTSFGDGGVVVTDLSDRDAGIGVAIVESGKIVVGARAKAPDRSDPDFAILRYNNDGSLDTGFGAGGVTLSDVSGSGAEDFVNSLIVQDDGKVVVVGGATIEGTSRFAIARYTPNGFLDSTFGNAGVAEFASFGANLGDYATDVAIQADGGIVAAGHVAFLARSTSASHATTPMAVLTTPSAAMVS